jgi:outer membrane receptor protein involved in Fe transport
VIKPAAFLALLIGCLLSAEEVSTMTGVVRDDSGAPVAGAVIRASADGRPLASMASERDGGFAFDPGPFQSGRLCVTAFGFEPLEQDWSVTDGPILLVLQPVRLAEEVTVTASRTEARLGDTASRVVVLSRADLLSSAALTVDDALRQIPGFSLFRRSGSRVANPTAQGASLRGVGPSAASRTLVLLDGLSLNDPFGGWVYWSRVPRIAVERVEVVEGGTSDLYGSAGLGGVIQVVARDSAPAVSLEASGGNEGTAMASLFAAVQSGGWGLRLASEGFTTDGYILVADDKRGPLDTTAAARHLNGTLTVDRRFSSSLTAFVRGALFGESRKNGTPLQLNDTGVQEVNGGSDWTSPSAGAFTLRGGYSAQSYHQTFTAVSADRASEALTRDQRVPSTLASGSLQWSRAVGSRHALVAGLEGHWVEGRSNETAFAQAKATALLSAGGHEQSWALFAADRVSLGSRILLTAGARLDHWREAAGSSSQTPLGPGSPSITQFPDRTETAISPRAAVLFRATRQLRLTVAGYGAFRAPSLNELYRSFRVGNTLTLANPDLNEERLWGGEVGTSWSTRDERLRVRAVGFLARIDNPVSNVTVKVTPQLITRQRQNLGRTGSRGAELDAEALLGRRLRVALGYALTDAAVQRFGADPTLVGNDVPQVPRHQLTFEARYANARVVDVAVQGRVSSRQFEDDQNRLPLAGYFALDLQVSRHLGRIEAFAALENATDHRYPVGLTPIETLGPALLARAGVRLDWRRPAPR